MDLEVEAAILRASHAIAAGQPIVGFTGAGISVESGIPDFRSPGGLWSKYDPNIYCNFHVFQERPELFWEMAVDMHATMASAQPNPAHVAMAQLEQLGLLSCIITQNVDNLHQQAGSKLVYELHGNASTSTCLSCKEKFATDELISQLKSNKTKVPKCPVCDGVIKMDAVLFGESLPRSVMENAMNAARKAKVSPACYIVELGKLENGTVLICDPNPSNADKANVMLCGPAGELLPRLVKACMALLDSY